MLTIKQIEDKEIWNSFVASQPYTPFVQSWQHGVFNTEMGESFWVFGVYENNHLVGGSLVLSVHAKRGNFLFLPYGPILGEVGREECLEALLDFLKKFARENGYSFIRFSPFWEKNEHIEQMLKRLHCLPSPMHILAEDTWLLDLQPSEEELLQNMNKNHRNLIRRCQKEGGTVILKTDAEAVKEFNELHEETVKKHKFHRYSWKYIEKQFEVLSKDNAIAVFHGYLPDGRLDASAITPYFGSMAAYYHGASIGADKHIPLSYLVQWHAILEAKKRGMRWYNFWGVAPDDAPASHPFKGITHFKKGFGGHILHLVHAQDVPVKFTYTITRIIELIRKKKRGF